MGVFSERLVPQIAEVLATLGVRRAFVVHGDDGLDEITTTTGTTIAEVRDGKMTSGKITSTDFGVPEALSEDLRGGDSDTNRVIVEEVLAGISGPQRDIVVVNASASLVAAGKVEDFKEGVEVAARSIDSGEAANRLRHLAEFTTNIAGQ